ncbi:hypothetical protein C8A05DRAFT_30092 [Staphylotrichum tortipilum]|uniref:Uncharacterized protein n=1 Tax=Staphylotrichum tortipilum TaxID=2831512 RepID=A0AAN6MS40_9PEZI|nr:hypothetical protein C8A05DRAFT_30092 [Staphylotrichum longicolle]
MDTASAPANSDGGWVFRALTTASKRLFWTLNGPLEDAIRVAPSEYYDPGVLDSMEPYFGPDGSPHAVSQASLLEPLVSSVTVRVQCIDDWDQRWAAEHWRCGELERNAPDRNPGRLGPRPDDETRDPVLLVFLTVHEYVSAVHPWLMAMRDTLLDVLGKLDGNPKWPPETKLAVLYLGPGPLQIGHEDGWAWWHRRPRPFVVHPSIAHLSEEERTQRTMERMMARAAAQVRAREEAEK